MPNSFFKKLRLNAVAASAAVILTAGTLSVSAPRQAFAQVLTAEQQADAAGTYSIDKPHSSISFTVTHLAITKVHGRFDDFDGKIKVDAHRADDSSVNFTIKTDSVNTDNSQRDAHLKTDAFFDAAKYPDITFTSTKISKRRNGYVVIGNLTMHGVTKEVTLPFTVAGPVVGLEKGKHIGVETSVKIKRSDFGISTYPGVVGDDISISIELDLVKDGSIPPAPAK